MQHFRFAGPSPARILVPDCGVSSTVIHALSQGYDVIACEQDINKFNALLSLLETEIPATFDRKIMDLTLPTSALIFCDDDEALSKPKLLPIPACFARNAHKEMESSIIKKLSCYKVHFGLF